MLCIFVEEHLSESLTTPVNWNAPRKLAKLAQLPEWSLQRLQKQSLLKNFIELRKNVLNF